MSNKFSFTTNGRKIIHNIIGEYIKERGQNKANEEDYIRRQELSIILWRIENFIKNFCNNEIIFNQFGKIYESTIYNKKQLEQYDIITTTTPSKPNPFIWKLKYRPEKKNPIAFLFNLLKLKFYENCKTELNLGQIYYLFVGLLLDSLAPVVAYDSNQKQRLPSNSLAFKEMQHSGLFTFKTKNKIYYFVVDAKKEEAKPIKDLKVKLRTKPKKSPKISQKNTKKEFKYNNSNFPPL